MNETLKKIDSFKREELKKLLSQCTESQQNFFCRLYGDVATMDEEKITQAIQQCERTIIKNKGEK